MVRLARVSILVPRFGGTLPYRMSRWKSAPVCFNPRPPFRGDATCARLYAFTRYTCFNPRPPFRGDATQSFYIGRVMGVVSILVPRFGGTLPTHARLHNNVGSFQSSSPVSGGRYNATPIHGAHLQVFQSSSPVSGGRYGGTDDLSNLVSLFQSSSPVSGGRYWGGGCDTTNRSGFNPRPPFRGDATAPLCLLNAFLLFQSSSPVSGGRYRSHNRYPPRRNRFNPRPPFRGDATAILRTKRQIKRVSILVPRFGGTLPAQPP